MCVAAPSPRISPGSLSELRQAVQAIETASRPKRLLGLGEPALAALLPQAGLRLGALHEIAPAAHFEGAAAQAFCLALAVRALAAAPGEFLWISRGVRNFGAAYGPGLAGFGLDPRRVLLVRPRSRQEALWAAEEAARAVAGPVLAELGEEGADLVAARRLQLAAESSGALLLLLRPPGAAPAPPADTRWRVAAAPSLASPWGGLGDPRFRLELLRARGALSAAAVFELEWRHATGAFHLPAPLADRAAAARGAPPRRGFALAG